MHRSLLVLSTSLAVVGAGALAASPALAARKAKPPVVASASPMSLVVGQPLTLRGTGLKAGTARTSVVFQREGGKAIFARATRITSTSLTVVVPAAVQAQLPTVDGALGTARFRLRILTTRFSRGFTAPKLSPMIGPALGSAVAAPVGASPAPEPSEAPAPAALPGPVATTPARTDVVTPRPETTPEPAASTPSAPTTAPDVPTTTTTPATSTGDTPPATPPACATSTPDGDADGDGLTNATEVAIKTDPCVADTDGDGVSDYFEQQSALALNSAALPYPGKRPYPNALDRSDAATDFDGDGLTLFEESAAWTKTGAPKVLTYSDGTQFTGGLVRVGTMPGEDYDHNGVLSDDEKDVDDDGIGNWQEQHGAAQPGWWAMAFQSETPYAGRAFLGLDYLDADTDGDGLKDGADDEDHDGFTNAQELIRPSDWADTYVSTAHAGTDPAARVNPFNPCKPYYSSKCHTHPPFGAYAPGEDWASPIHADGP